MLTTADILAGYTNDEWEGFGYLGERRNQAAEGRSTVEADEMVLADANKAGMTAEALFEWANSRSGRYFGDCMFGGLPQHAPSLLPSQGRR